MENLDITFTEEQGMLMDTAQNFCRDNSSFEKVRQLIETEHGYDEKVWQEMTELGWAGIAIAEEFGGSGLSIGDLVPVFEAMGRRLLSAPLFSNVLASQLLIAAGTQEQKSQWLPKIAQGEIIATVAINEMNGSWHVNDIEASVTQSKTLTLQGTKAAVLDAAVADIIITAVKNDKNALQLILLEKDEVKDRLNRESTIDETRRGFRLDLSNICIAPNRLLKGGDIENALKLMTKTAWLLLSAEMAGGTNGVMDETVEYLKLRKQFGKPIGAYQSLKHPMADILCELESSRSHCYHSATVFDGDNKQAEVATRMALAQASQTFTYASDRAVQFHGGFGFTYECNAQLFLRRARWSEFAYGDAQHQRKQLAALLLQ